VLLPVHFTGNLSTELLMHVQLSTKGIYFLYSSIHESMYCDFDRNQEELVFVMFLSLSLMGTLILCHSLYNPRIKSILLHLKSVR
jgi:hypothetical protein